MELIALLTLALVLAGLLLRTSLRRQSIRRRARRAAEAENRAARLARRFGYRILGTQVPGGLVVWAGTESKRVGLRADLLVSRGGRRFIGEVKSGKRAPDPTHAPTRRQLLEYAYAFRADGLLLFDMEAEEIREIRFETVGTDRPRPSALLYVVVFAVGALVTWTVEHLVLTPGASG